MKKSILTMCFVIFISSLNSVTAAPFVPGLCTGGPIHATEVYTKVFAPPLLPIAPIDAAAYCANACSAHVDGCLDVAKTATLCRLGLTNDLLRQDKELCGDAVNISDCKQAVTLAANDRKDNIQDQKATAVDFCNIDVYPVCVADCIASLSVLPAVD